MDEAKTRGQMLRAKREDEGVTQTELAVALGFRTAASISNRESDKIAMDEEEYALAWAAICRITKARRTPTVEEALS